MRYIVTIILFALSMNVYSYEKYDLYPNELYYNIGNSISRDRFTQPQIEIVYSPDAHKFGVSFFDELGDDITYPKGLIIIRSCGTMIYGEFKETTITFYNEGYDKLKNIFENCDKPIYTKIFLNYSRQATYKLTSFKEFSKNG